MRSSDIGVLTLSDIHLGHKNTTAETILDNLRAFLGDFRMVNNYDELKLIIIAGDLWHHALSFGSPNIPSFTLFWYSFMSWCQAKGIVIRLMLGTPYHDDKQGLTVAAQTKCAFPNLDFKYVDTISIEQHAGLGVSMLFVPDESRPDAALMYDAVLEVLHEAGLEQVDIGVMHGMFSYQAGNIPLTKKTHEEKHYLPLVKSFITVGHIHIQSSFERIYAQGSFDRISHGEEAPKGAYYFTLHPDGSFEARFLINDRAQKYVTIKLPRDVEKAIKLLDKTAHALPRFSHLRYESDPDHDVYRGFETYVKKYPWVRLSRKKTKDEKLKPKKTASGVPAYEGLSLNRTTLTQALFNEVSLKHTLSPEEARLLHARLESFHI